MTCTVWMIGMQNQPCSLDFQVRVALLMGRNSTKSFVMPTFWVVALLTLLLLPRVLLPKPLWECCHTIWQHGSELGQWIFWGQASEKEAPCCGTSPASPLCDLVRPNWWWRNGVKVSGKLDCSQGVGKHVGSILHKWEFPQQRCKLWTRLRSWPWLWAWTKPWELTW